MQITKFMARILYASSHEELEEAMMEANKVFSAIGGEGWETLHWALTRLKFSAPVGLRILWKWIILLPEFVCWDVQYSVVVSMVTLGSHCNILSEQDLTVISICLASCLKYVFIFLGNDIPFASVDKA